MSTLILSDLHLGSIVRSDLLRLPEPREVLLQAVANADRVVLLGDVLELRHGPMREAMEIARPFLSDLGAACRGRELVIVAGNHDHALVEPWLAARGLDRDPGPLGPEQLLEPADVSPAMQRLASWAAPARVRVAYPGLWVRPDVYATHGHYLDCHLTVPTLERLSVAAMSRILAKPASGFSCADDYEALGSPVYAWRDAVARNTRTGDALNGIATVSAWNALNGGSRGARRSLAARLKRSALVAGFPLAVAALNRAGIGPLSANISPAELRRAGLRAMGEVAARLELGDCHVVFGHTHRPGPLPGDDEREWLGRSGAKLVNTGSWTYSAIFLTARQGESPYWPGCCVLVPESGEPEVLRMLQDFTHEQLAPGFRGRERALT
jgi:predicted phosphodiesterase